MWCILNDTSHHIHTHNTNKHRDALFDDTFYLLYLWYVNIRRWIQQKNEKYTYIYTQYMIFFRNERKELLNLQPSPCSADRYHNMHLYNIIHCKQNSIIRVNRCTFACGRLFFPYRVIPTSRRRETWLFSFFAVNTQQEHNKNKNNHNLTDRERDSKLPVNAPSSAPPSLPRENERDSSWKNAKEYGPKPRTITSRGSVTSRPIPPSLPTPAQHTTVEELKKNGQRCTVARILL